MLLESAPAFKILGVYRIKREYHRGSTGPRPWAAIAIRLSGASRFESDGVSILAPEGSVIYIPEGVAFSCRGSEEELVIIHLKVFDPKHEKIEVYEPKNYAKIAALFISLYEEWEAKRTAYQHICSQIIFEILGELTSCEPCGVGSYRSRLILPGTELINTDFENPSLTVESAAKASSVSPEYFREIYKSVFGISPHKAIEKKRIEKACHLLEAGYFSIAEVAEECGFKGVKYFSTLFRARVGISPREYKNKFNL